MGGRGWGGTNGKWWGTETLGGGGGRGGRRDAVVAVDRQSRCRLGLEVCVCVCVCVMVCVARADTCTQACLLVRSREHTLIISYVTNFLCL
jgi:hypothetical protein